MSSAGRIRYLITSSNTSQGFRTFIPDLLDDLDKVLIIKGVPGTGKATLIRYLGEKAAENGFDIEYWISAVDPQSPEGLCIPELNTAVINGSLPISIDASYPRVRDHIFDLNNFLTDLPATEIEEIKQLSKDIEQNKTASQKYLSEAQHIKKQMAQLSCQGIKTHQYAQLVKEITATILNRRSGEKHYFATAFTPDGIISYMNELSAEYPKRYIFKGCSNFQNSMISEIAQEIKKNGYYVEFYHSGLEPNRVLMVIIRDLQSVLLEADEIRILQRPEDIIINLRDFISDDQPMEENEDLYAIYQSYVDLLNKATRELESLRQKVNEIGKRYAAKMDFAGLERLRTDMMQDIFTII